MLHNNIHPLIHIEWPFHIEKYQKALWDMNDDALRTELELLSQRFGQIDRWELSIRTSAVNKEIFKRKYERMSQLVILQQWVGDRTIWLLER